MGAHLEILLIAVVVAVSCSLPGTFLVLRKRALISDAVSHAVLPGIVIGFFLTENLSSPLLMIGAVGAGLFTAWATELLTRTRLLKEDAAIGLVFPVLFSLGVILVSRYAGNVHLDTDAVLLGELAFAPFDRLRLGGYDLGPRSLWSMGTILLLNTAGIVLFFKELKLSTFDSGLAHAQGFSPGLLHYGLMTLVSITVVGAFDSVGSILVVALMIAPPAAAYLLTRRLERLLPAAALIGALSALGGYALAAAFDLSIAGSMAAMCGLSFALALLFAPRRGLVAQRLLKKDQKLDLGVRMLVVHLSHHSGLGDGEASDEECRRDHLTRHINWSEAFAGQVVQAAAKRALIQKDGALLSLTREGTRLAAEAMTR